MTLPRFSRTALLAAVLVAAPGLRAGDPGPGRQLVFQVRGLT